MQKKIHTLFCDGFEVTQAFICRKRLWTITLKERREKAIESDNMRLLTISSATHLLAFVARRVGALDASWPAADALVELQERAIAALKASETSGNSSSSSCSLATASVRQDW